MTRTSLHPHQDSLHAGPPSPAAPEVYEVLCRAARELREDAGFLALTRRPGVRPQDVVRLALDAVPSLELLPLPVLAEELAALFRGGAPRSWSA
ncbi:hypothetical protein DAETH_39270 (plasmid) [Deinococcus aetherius]|uniref:Uncharacterized protein n=1 Tax=Deinococcus aetherius TaxID=200252 RepID=A0ABN6RQ35_9DEIO|nr:hypothetical protein [Deinococcus aetherius]BDP43958.1 hypothetical protein DAETH_39270 [Deinococcus aetherius]